MATALKQSREEWLEQRRQGIGGSDVAAVLGISKYKSPIALWLEKTGMVESEDISDVEAVYWGTTLEDVVAREFERRTGKRVKRKNAMLFHPEHPFMLANVDRLVVGEKAGMECKTAGIYQADKWDGDEIPDAYFLQCQHYMAVTGFKKWYIAVLIAGQRFIWKEIAREDNLIKAIVDQEAAFWRLVENRIRPEVDGSEASAKVLKEMLPRSNGQTVELGSEADFWIRQYRMACSNLEEQERFKMEAENKLKDMLGENETGNSSEGTVIWKSVKSRETFDTKRFKADHPELAPAYISEGNPTRRFSIQ